MTSAIGLRVQRALVGIAAIACVTGMNEGAARAADVPTQLRLSWLETCMTAGTITLAVNGTTVGSYPLIGDQATCTSNDPERSVTLADPGALGLLDTKACNLYTVTFNNMAGSTFLFYVRVQATYSASGVESVCIKDTSNQGCAFRNTSANRVSIVNGTSYSSTLTDVMPANGIPDCREGSGDGDNDGVLNQNDNCPYRENSNQADGDSDGTGDVCDNCAAIANANQADSDVDGYGNACDNCPNNANPTQADCNANQVGDACEGQATNQDPDGDGKCTGVDNCPSVNNPDQTDTNMNGIGNVCDVMAVTVPWVPANPNVPHPTYSGFNTTLKGIARNGATQYFWEYGDGSPNQPLTNIANAYNLGVKHVYNGAVGQNFFAVLHVRNGNNESTAVYPLQIQDAGVLAGGITQPQMDVRINVSIDEGLWYLHINQTRSTFAANAPGYGQPYGNWADNGLHGTCVAMDAFQLHGSKVNKDFTTDPYVEDVQRAMNYVVGNFTWFTALSNQVNAGVSNNPDVNSNGIGIWTNGSSNVGDGNSTYVGGICGAAIASAGAPNYVSQVGQSLWVRGRTLADIVQDMVDFWVWGATDSGSGEGGWQYFANQQSTDGSTAQWPVLIMAAAEDNMGSTVPAFMRVELNKWWTFSRKTNHTGDSTGGGGDRCGGWGYSDANTYINLAKTAAGISEAHFLNVPVTDSRVKGGIGFMNRFWAADASGWYAGIGNSYTMYGIMKAMRFWQPNILVLPNNTCEGADGASSFDWYYNWTGGGGQEGLAANLIRRQQAGGNWSDTNGNNAVSGSFATGWDVLILLKGVTTIPPTALICDCANQTYDQNQDVTVSGACSSHDDLNRTVVKYEWDFNYNPAMGFNVQATGQQVTRVGGYPNYQNYTIALRVTDDNPPGLGGPQSSINTCAVVIKPPPHCPHPDAGGGQNHVYNGFIGVPVQFSALGSFDPDNDPLTYNWSLNGNGVFGDAGGVSPSFTYNTPGTYSVGVQVTDHPDQNPIPYMAAPCTKTAFATVVIGNHAPTSNPGGPYQAAAGQTIILDGSGSADIDPGDVITYAWDLNNDGTFGDSTQVRPNYAIPANAALGTVFSICLRVTDKAGLRDTRCTTVTVPVATPPTCNAGMAATQECTGANVSFMLDGSGSSDAQGRMLTYTWTGGNCDVGTVTFDDIHLAKPTATVNAGHLGMCTDKCTAMLSVSNGFFTTVCQVSLTVRDSLNPTVTPPAPFNAECNGNGAFTGMPQGAMGSDQCTEPVAVSGPGVNSYPLGPNQLHYSATDGCGLTASGDSTMTVVDTTPPAIVCPGVVVAECNGQGRASNVQPGQAQTSDVCLSSMIVESPPGGTYELGTYMVLYKARDQAGLESTCNGTIQVLDSTPAMISCAPPQTVECTGNSRASAFVQPPVFFDLCDNTRVVVYGPSGQATYPLGFNLLTFSATDLGNNAVSCNTSVNVIDTRKPTITCPPNINIECTGNNSTFFTPLKATGTDTCSVVSVNNPPAQSFPMGPTTLTYTDSDSSGNTNSCQARVTVRDSTRPVVTSAGGGYAQTVNGNDHTMVNVDVRTDCALVISDVCAGQINPANAGILITCVTSDENNVGPEATSPDIVITGNTTLQVRRERDDAGDGRVYHINFTAKDPSGNTASGTCNIRHPLDINSPAVVDSGVKYTVCK